jgi:methyltransferase (TIGR00027 family)
MNLLLNDVQKSCLVLAGVRALNSIEKPDLFYDPFAEHIYNLYKESIESDPIFKWNKSKEHFAYRMTSIDKLIEESNFEQVVIIGCGMDSRVFRLKELKSKVVFEIDLEEVIQLRDQLILSSGCKYDCNRISISSDCNQPDNFMQKCIDKGFNPKFSTCWIIEGLLMYLTDKEACSLLQVCVHNSGKQSTIVGSYANEALVKLAQQSGTALGKNWKSYFQNPDTKWFEPLGCKLKTVFVPGNKEGIKSDCYELVNNKQEWNETDPLPLVFKFEIN